MYLLPQYRFERRVEPVVILRRQSEYGYPGIRPHLLRQVPVVQQRRHAKLLALDPERLGGAHRREHREPTVRRRGHDRHVVRVGHGASRGCQLPRKEIIERLVTASAEAIGVGVARLRTLYFRMLGSRSWLMSMLYVFTNASMCGITNFGSALS